MYEAITERRRQVLHDEKWFKFMGRVWPFRLVPFVEFAIAAGSMAMGNVRLESDFDVIVGARPGRIFTARFFSVLIFGLLGWRRKKISHKTAAADKICLNHFITPKSYKLLPPHNKYWQALYSKLVPVWGDSVKISEFFAANADWSSASYQDDLRHSRRSAFKIKNFLENALDGRLGDTLERILRKIQIARIERNLKNELGYEPRIRYSDDELEFHPDTARIEILEKEL